MFIASLVGGLLVGGLAEAQPAAAPLIGLLPLGSPTDAYDQSLVEAFREGLREAGVVEPRDVMLEVAWTKGELEVAQAVVRLKQRGVRLLIPVGTAASMTVRRQAPDTPILFISVGNPQGIGLVNSLRRPGGQVTGFSDVLAELSSKYVQFAIELNKPAGVAFYVWHSGWTDGQYRFQRTEDAAKALNVRLRSQAFADEKEVDDAMAAMKEAGASIVIVQPSPFTFRLRDRLIEAATTRGLATIFAFRPAAPAGALITYGPDYADLNRRAASYLARVLKGTMPGDLPVEQPTKFELLINLKTARSLGVVVPESLRLRADLLIE